MVDFPNSPSLNQLFESWRWDGSRWLSAGIAAKAVMFDQVQTLDPSEQQQARDNIGVAGDATAGELRAGTQNKVVGTTGLQGAIGYVPYTGISGWWAPEFHNFLNASITLAGPTTLAWAASDITDIWGRSGLMIFNNGVAGCTLSFQSGAMGYSFHRYEAPDMSTDPGWWNFFAYQIWGAHRINLAFLGAIY